jgi:hypothetical protein
LVSIFIHEFGHFYSNTNPFPFSTVFAISEGINTFITQIVTKKYFGRDSYVAGMAYNHEYLFFTQILNVVIRKIAKETGSPVEDIKIAFIKMAFENFRELDRIVLKEMSNIFGEEMSNEYRKLSDSNDIAYFRAKFNDKVIELNL